MVRALTAFATFYDSLVGFTNVGRIITTLLLEDDALYSLI